MKILILKKPDLSLCYVSLNPMAKYVGDYEIVFEGTNLPSEYVHVLTEQNQAEAQEKAKKKVKNLFAGIRQLWQSLSDEFAAENASKGITSEGKTKEVADKFSSVIYYLNCNAPMEAIRELNLMTTDDKYITPAVITKMSNTLLTYIQDNK